MTPRDLVRPAHTAARMLVALALAFALTQALNLQSGYWAMITVTVVVQDSLGGTLDAGLARFTGTVVGGLFGMAGVLARTHHILPEWAVLSATMAPLALLAASTARLRTGPLTALIVLLITPHTGSSIGLAMSRIAEITLGCVIGVAVSLVVFPSRARAAFEGRVADALQALGARTRCLGDGGTLNDAAASQFHTASAAADAALVALVQERTLRLVGALPADAVVRALRRLNTDVDVLARALQPTHEHGRVAVALQAQFDGLANALRTRCPPPRSENLQIGAAQLPLQLALEALGRDLSEMAERITDYLRADSR